MAIVSIRENEPRTADTHFSGLWLRVDTEPGVAALIIGVIRTILEDRTPQGELPGYQDYARRIRYRLIQST